MRERERESNVSVIAEANIAILPRIRIFVSVQLIKSPPSLDVKLSKVK